MAGTDADMPQSAGHVWFSKAFLDVAAERRRHMEEEEHSVYELEDTYQAGQLERAGAAYALYSCLSNHRWFIADIWSFRSEWFKPRSHRENLVLAASFLIAAIERLDRANG